MKEERREAMDEQLDYLERTLSDLVDALKKRNCLDQEFKFLTKAERNQCIEDFMELVIKTEDHHPGVHHLGPHQTES